MTKRWLFLAAAALLLAVVAAQAAVEVELEQGDAVMLDGAPTLSYASAIDNGYSAAKFAKAILAQAIVAAGSQLVYVDNSASLLGNNGTSTPLSTPGNMTAILSNVPSAVLPTATATLLLSGPAAMPFASGAAQVAAAAFGDIMVNTTDANGQFAPIDPIYLAGSANFNMTTYVPGTSFPSFMNAVGLKFNVSTTLGGTYNFSVAYCTTCTAANYGSHRDSAAISVLSSDGTRKNIAFVPSSRLITTPTTYTVEYRYASTGYGNVAGEDYILGSTLGLPSGIKACNPLQTASVVLEPGTYQLTFSATGYRRVSSGAAASPTQGSSPWVTSMLIIASST